MAGTVPGVLLTGNHAGRPSSGVSVGTLYSCTTHGLIYQTTDTGSTWGTWATLGTAASGSITASGYTQTTARLLGRTTASTGAIEEITVGSGLSLAAGALTATGGGGVPPILALDFNLAADVSNQAITANTFFDMFANQNFSVTSASSLVEVIVRGNGFTVDTVNNSYITRVNIDSAGTPILSYFPGGQSTAGGGTNPRVNPFVGGSIFLSGLSVATHTAKIQFTVTANNDHLFCRPATVGPPTGGEFLSLQIIEHV